MARIRSIKLDLFMDDGLAPVSLEAHFLLAGLPCLADRDGRLEDRPRRIQAQIFPYRTGVDVDRCLDELARSGHIRRYETDGQRYLQVENWGQDQRPHIKEAPSSIPPPQDSSEHRQGSKLARNSPGTPRCESAGILGVGSGVLDSGSGDLPPPSSAAPREELRLEPQQAARRAAPKKTRPEKPVDPRHAPLTQELCEVHRWPHHGGRTARAVTELLALADQVPGTSGPEATWEINRRAALARASEGFPRVRELHELVTHWGHFAEAAPRSTSPQREDPNRGILRNNTRACAACGEETEVAGFGGVLLCYGSPILGSPPGCIDRWNTAVGSGEWKPEQVHDWARKQRDAA